MWDFSFGKAIGTVIRILSFFILKIVAHFDIGSADRPEVAIACPRQVYFKIIEGQSPNAKWIRQLSQALGKFCELSVKAVEWASGPQLPERTKA